MPGHDHTAADHNAAADSYALRDDYAAADDDALRDGYAAADDDAPPGDREPRQAEPADAGVERALAVAYRYLNRRERTQEEMRAQLSRAGTDPRDVERAVASLVEQGFLDDRRFVRLFVQDKRELEEWGSDRLRLALLAKGVDRDVVEEALGEHDTGAEIDRAVAILRRRFPSPPGDRRERERALGMLLRKGYDSELALDAIAAHSRHRDEA